MHIVTWNTAYGTMENAMTHPDGLAVLAFLFEVCAATTPTSCCLFVSWSIYAQNIGFYSHHPPRCQTFAVWQSQNTSHTQHVYSLKKTHFEGHWSNMWLFNQHRTKSQVIQCANNVVFQQITCGSNILLMCDIKKCWCYWHVIFWQTCQCCHILAMSHVSDVTHQ